MPSTIKVEIKRQAGPYDLAAIRYLIAAFILIVCSQNCHAQSHSQMMASCYKDADRFVANANDGTIDTSKIAPEKLNSTIEKFRSCIGLAQTSSSSTWNSETTVWRYTSVLWAAVALAQDGLLSETAAMLEKCNSKR
jgi:hypothetical protein